MYDVGAEAAAPSQPTMVQPRPAMHGVPVAQPGLQGNTNQTQPMQHVQHVAPVGHMTSSGMVQTQPGQPAQPDHILNAHHIISQYQASNPNAHAQGARPHYQAPQHGGPGSMAAATQPRPRPGAGVLVAAACAATNGQLFDVKRATY